MGGRREGLKYAERAETYARQVVAGEIDACKWVRLACQRHLDDLGRPITEEFPFHFDADRANDVCWFIEGLQHVKGKWKSKNIELEDHQCFKFAAVFGWVDGDGLRRFRKAYVEVPRKNAKTTDCAGVGLYMLAVDGEEGAEVYSAAVTRDQAKISLDIGQKMARKDEALRDHYGLTVWTHTIAGPRGSSWHALGSDHDSLDGRNIHCAIVDELHAHKTREVYDAIEDGMGSRRQPLMWIITTAGSNKHGICYEVRDYVCQVLDGRVQDERIFGIIYTVDEEDLENWSEERMLRKANPNYNVSVIPTDILSLCKQAVSIAGKQNDFKTKRLNIWTSAGTAYFNSLAWDTLCKVDGLEESEFVGERCWFGLDLASKWDLTAFTRLYLRGDVFYIFGTYFLPEAACTVGKPNFDTYRGWQKRELLDVMDSTITDFPYIQGVIVEKAQQFGPEAIVYDPHQATETAGRLVAEGLPMVELPQNFTRMNEPMKKLGALILSGAIKHDGNPVLSWGIANTVGKENFKEEVMPAKDRPEDKIDPAVAAMMCLSPTLVVEEMAYANGFTELSV